MDPQTAEAGETYLNSMGFRSLIEWITAESLLARPEDPLMFIRSIIDEKIAERASSERYQADHALSYVKQCYAAASASADENGRIVVKPRKIASSTVNRHSALQASSAATSNSAAGTDVVLIKRLATLEKVITACRQINMALDPDEATTIIIKQACVVLNADRATLFVFEKATQMLVLKVSEGAADIRVPCGKGIAGTVAATGKAVNISDAYSDPNFDSQYDKQTGYKTKAILCVPVRNGENKIVGVVQVLNKVSTDKEQCFSEMDEEIMEIIAAQAGVALHNAKTHTQAVLAGERVRDVLNIVKSMHRDLGFNPLMFTISTGVQRLVNSDRCTLYIVDHNKQELWTLQGEVNIRVPITQGIAGAVALKNEIIMLEDAYTDPRFNKDFDQKLGYRTRSVLAMPLLNNSGEVTAVLQLINKGGELGVFTMEDQELLDTFLQIAGPILASSQSSLAKPVATDGAPEFPGKVGRVAAVEVVEMNVISENDEEEG